MENKDPKTFQDVKVFAVNNFNPAAAVTYRNLVRENNFFNRSTSLSQLTGKTLFGPIGRPLNHTLTNNKYGVMHV